MKNTLSIMSDGTICDCVDSVADGTNSLYIELEVGNVTSPQLKIWLNDVLKSTTTLTANEINYINVSPELFTANGVITFQYLDDDYTGQVFTINFPSSLDGNLSVDKTSDYVFTVKYTKSDDVSIVIDSELSTTSENAVQNKVVTDALNNKQNKLTIDSALSTTSTNPVQNKVVTNAVNLKCGKIKSGTVSGTTNANGYLITNIPFDNLIFCAMDLGMNGYAIIPTNVNNTYWFYVCGTSAGHTIGFGNMNISIRYYYIDTNDLIF